VVRAGPADAHRLEIPSLDGVRALSILIVFAGHAGAGKLVPGGLGVTIFFVLSGYLITTLLRLELEANGSISIRKFYLRRFFRIVPLFYTVLTITLAATLWLGLGRGAVDWGSAAAQYLHVSNYWSISQTGRPVMDGTGVYWSLAVEEHFYLLFPVGYALLARFCRPKKQAMTFAALCAVVLIWRVVLTIGLNASEVRTYYATDTRIDSILIGCVLAIAANPALGFEIRPRVAGRQALVAMAVLGGTLLLRQPDFRETVRYSVQSIAVALIISYVVGNPSGVAGRFLNWRPVVALGKISYAFYLVHLVIIYEVGKHFGTLSTAVMSFAISCLLAKALQLLVERPGINLRHSLFPGSTRTERLASHGVLRGRRTH
jgi:peptidoglycan/LPS O-acetylase OafA/YrhL